jgi:hypothetical protein
MVKPIKTTRTISLVDGKLLFKPNKEVSSPDPFNAGFKDVETITGITGAIA